MAFVESAILALVDRVSPTLKTVNANLRAFEKQVASTSAGLGKLNASSAGWARQVEAMGARASRAASTSANAQLGAMRKVEAEAARAERAHIARQINSAKVDERRRQSDVAAAAAAARQIAAIDARAERDSINRQLRSAAVEQRRRADETRAIERSSRAAMAAASVTAAAAAKEARAIEQAAERKSKAEGRATRSREDALAVARRAGVAVPDPIRTGDARGIRQHTLDARHEQAAVAREQRQMERERRNGYFGRFPENIPALAATVAGYRTVTTAGSAMRAGGHGIVEAATERTAQELQGLTPEQIERLRKESGQLGSRYQNISAAGIAELGRNAIPNLKNPNDAGAVMESMARHAAVLAVTYRDGTKGTEAARQMFRAADMAGAADDPARLNEWLSQLTKATTVAGRDINPQMLAQSIARLGALKMSLGGDAIGDVAMLQDEARGQAANYMRTFFNDLTRSNLATKNMEAMIAGGIRTSDGSGAVNQRLLGSDPFAWVMQELKPKLAKMGVDFSKRDSDPAAFTASATKALNKLGFLNSGMQFALWSLQKEDEVRRGREKRAAVRTDAEYVRSLPSRDLATGMTSVGEKWKDASDALTRFVQPLAGHVIGGTAGFLSGIAQDPMRYGVGGLVGAGALGAGAYALSNPGATAHVAAAGLHMRAAGALSAAAGLLGMSGLGRGRGGLGLAGLPVGVAGAAGAGAAAARASQLRSAAIAGGAVALTAAGRQLAVQKGILGLGLGASLARPGLMGMAWGGLKAAGRFAMGPWGLGLMMGDAALGLALGKSPSTWAFEQISKLLGGAGDGTRQAAEKAARQAELVAVARHNGRVREYNDLLRQLGEAEAAGDAARARRIVKKIEAEQRSAQARNTLADRRKSWGPARRAIEEREAAKIEATKPQIEGPLGSRRVTQEEKTAQDKAIEDARRMDEEARRPVRDAFSWMFPVAGGPKPKSPAERAAEEAAAAAAAEQAISDPTAKPVEGETIVGGWMRKFWEAIRSKAPAPPQAEGQTQRLAELIARGQAAEDDPLRRLGVVQRGGKMRLPAGFNGVPIVDGVPGNTPEALGGMMGGPLGGRPLLGNFGDAQIMGRGGLDALGPSGIMIQGIEGLGATISGAILQGFSSVGQLRGDPASDLLGMSGLEIPGLGDVGWQISDAMTMGAAEVGPSISMAMMEGAATAGADLTAALTSGADAISAAGSTMEGSISAGGAAGGAAMGGSIVAACGEGAGIIAAAISSAAANVHVNVTGAASAGERPANTGAMTAGR